jgi:hypothetical protein
MSGRRFTTRRLGERKVQTGLETGMERKLRLAIAGDRILILLNGIRDRL